MADEAITRVELTLQGGMRFEAKDGDGLSVTLDAGPQHGGEARGLSPMDLLLIGLGGCTGMDVISILRKKRQDVVSYRVEVEGVRAKDHPRIYTEIAIRHIVRGNNLSEEAVRRSIELSESKYCPAFAMLAEAAEISSTYEVLPAAPG